MDRCSMRRIDNRCRTSNISSNPNLSPPCCAIRDEISIDPFRLIDELPLTMAYVPKQQFDRVFEPTKALTLGTIFPELYKPFCGKRGNCR